MLNTSEDAFNLGSDKAGTLALCSSLENFALSYFHSDLGNITWYIVTIDSGIIGCHESSLRHKN